MKSKNKTGNSEKKSSFLNEYEAELDEETYEELTEAERRMLSHGSVSYNENNSEGVDVDEGYFDSLDGFVNNQPEEKFEKSKESTEFEEELDKLLAVDLEGVFDSNSQSADKDKSENNDETVTAAASVSSESIFATKTGASANKIKFDYASVENSEPVEPFVAKSSFFESSVSDVAPEESAELTDGFDKAEEFDSKYSDSSSKSLNPDENNLEGNLNSDGDNFSENLISDGDDVANVVDSAGDNTVESQDLADTCESNELTHEELAARKRRKITYNLLMIASLAVFIYCVGRIGIYFYTNYKYKQGMSELQDIVGDISRDPVITPEVVTDIYFPDERVYASTSVNFSNKEPSDSWKSTYANLVELNPDCVGWLKIPDTPIDYPVMYTPDDYDKYLYLDFKGDYLFRGLPFMAEGTLLNVSQNYLLYGHLMLDGTAFRGLLKYLDREWIAEHPYAYFNTAFNEGIYQVMAVVITKVYNVDDECFKYYKYTGDLTEDEFNTYVYYMKKMSSINTGIDAVYGDQLLTLSTCYDVYDENGRLVVVFKRIE